MNPLENNLCMNDSSGYPPFLKLLGEVLEGAPSDDSIVLLGIFHSQVGNNRGKIGRNDLLNLNLNGVLV